MLLSYYRLSDYLVQNSRQASPYQAPADSIAEVLVLADNWQAAHEEPEVILPINTAKKLLAIDWPKQFITAKIEEQDPHHKTGPLVPIEPKNPVNQIETPKHSRTWREYANLCLAYFIENALSLILWFLVLIGGLWLLSNLLRRRITESADLVRSKIPIGILPKKHKISDNFQAKTVDPVWLKVVMKSELNYVLTHRPDYVINDDFGDRPFLLEEAELKEASTTKTSTAAKVIAAPIRWIAPNIKTLSDFKFKIKASDIWAFLSNFLTQVLIGYVYRESPYWFQVVQLVFYASPLLLFLQIGLFRRSKIALWVWGIGTATIIPIVLLVMGLYFYLLEHPEALQGDSSPFFQWISSLATIGIIYWLFLKTSWGKRFATKRLGAKIWLKDDVFLGPSLFYNFLGIILFSILESEVFSSAFFFALLLNFILFIIAPTAEMAKEKQWTFSPQLAVLAMFIGLAGYSYLYLFDYRFTMHAYVYSSLLVHFSFYLLWFPRIDALETSPEDLKEKLNKEKEKPTLVKAFDKVIQSVKIQSKNTNENLNWWKLKNPAEVGMLNLANHGLSDHSENLLKLLLFKNIYQLYLNQNNFTVIPGELYLLGNLRKLDLSENNITHLPSKLSMLKNLVILELANNQIKVIPPWIKEMSALKILNLKGNPLSQSQVDRLKKEAPHLEIEF